jgi:23S rRNA (adenine2030-N6)-methyltransferase
MRGAVNHQAQCARVNYRHIYHAGNFADVAKHVALVYCLAAQKRKDSAFFALDTHAGRGWYDLHAPEARKSGEAEQGVQRVLQALAGESSLAPYFTAIGAVPGRRLARYPGSAAIIAGSLRPQDRALLTEIMPAEARYAERALESAGRLRVRAEDGYAALKAHLPPLERRGLVLIDPPYESAEELATLLGAFEAAYRRWPTGLYLIWYPILSAVQRRSLRARFEALKVPKLLAAELTVRPDDAGVGLAGSGLLIVNPPHGADEYLAQTYAALRDALAAPGIGAVEVARLTPERMAQ